MAFEETYKAEVLQSRRIRAQRAAFWAKLLGFVLMISIAAVLRSEPQLRTALLTAAVDGVSTVGGGSAGQKSAAPQSVRPLQGRTGQQGQSQDAQQLQDVLARINRPPLPTDTPEQPIATHRFQDAVKVNRFGQSTSGPTGFSSVPSAAPTSIPTGAGAPDMSVIAKDLNKILKTMSPGQ